MTQKPRSSFAKSTKHKSIELTKAGSPLQKESAVLLSHAAGQVISRPEKYMANVYKRSLFSTLMEKIDNQKS